MSVKTQIIKPDGLETAITGVMNEVQGASDRALKYAVDRTASESAKTIRGRAPVRRRGRSRGYNRSWSHRVEKASRLGYQRVVFSSKPYLPHLLQWGHGGPVPHGPIPHIPEDTETEAVFSKHLQRAIKKEL
jgi:hypothetical protein